MKEKQIQLMLDTFTNSFQSVVISTITKDGSPYSSYTPFIKYESNYYLLMSPQAVHYKNITANNKVSLLFIEDEKTASSIFFRKRLSYLATTERVYITNELKEALIEKHGSMINTLLGMQFVLIKTNIIQGNIIVGPGAAYLIDNDNKIIKQQTDSHNSK